MMKLYCIWASLAVGLAFLAGGKSPDNLTRVLVLSFLLGSLLWQRYRPGRPHLRGAEFVLDATWRALLIEFFYLFSRPVFPSLLHQPGDSLATLIQHTLTDWAFTLPAYLLIFSVFWWLLQRYHYSLTAYIILFSAGQALGDGQAYFLANPFMIPWIPYVMTNYQAINIVPYLRAQGALPKERMKGPWWLPLLVVPCTYFLAGACINWVGRWFNMLGN